MPKYPYRDLGLPLDLTNWEQLNKNFDDIESDIRNIGTNVLELVVDEAKLNWLEPVNTFVDLVTTYPSAEKGDAVYIRDSGKVFRFNGVQWKEIQQLELGPFGALENKMNRIWLDPRSFGAAADGVTDDTAAFESMLASAVKPGQYIISKGNYLLSSPIDVEVDNVTFDFSGSKVIWNGLDDLQNGTTREIGMFNAKGTVGDSFTISSFDLNVVESNRLRSKVTVPDTSLFPQGAYAQLTISNGVYSDTELRPKVDMLVQVTEVSGNELYLDYVSPWRFPSSGFTATLKPVTPRFNVKFENLIIEDIVPVTGAPNPNATYSEREHLVSGISFKYAIGCEVRNIFASNTKFPVVLARYTDRLRVDKGTLDRPAIVGSGEGYLLQANFSKNVIVRDLKSYKARHLIDFTGSGYCLVEMAFGNDSYSNTFQLHGSYEHDVTFYKCNGDFGNASGTEFGNANMNVSLIEFKGVLSGGGYCEGLSIEYSSVKFTRGYTAVNVRDSEVEIYAVNDMEFKKRGELISTKWIMSDCKITFDDTKNTANVRGCEIFMITGKSEVYFIGNNPDLSLGGKECFLYDTREAVIEGARIDTAKFSLRGTAKNARYSNNKCVARASGFQFSSRDITNSEMTVHVIDNTFEKNALFPVGAVYMPSTNNTTTTNVDAIIRGNISKDCDWTMRNVGTGKVIYQGNIIKGGTITKDTLAVDANNVIA